MPRLPCHSDNCRSRYGLVVPALLTATLASCWQRELAELTYKTRTNFCRTLSQVATISSCSASTTYHSEISFESFIATDCFAMSIMRFTSSIAAAILLFSAGIVVLKPLGSKAGTVDTFSLIVSGPDAKANIAALGSYDVSFDGGELSSCRSSLGDEGNILLERSANYIPQAPRGSAKSSKNPVRSRFFFTATTAWRSSNPS